MGELFWVGNLCLSTKLLDANGMFNYNFQMRKMFSSLPLVCFLNFLDMIVNIDIENGYRIVPYWLMRFSVAPCRGE